jgi:hypothetical protein
MDLGLLTTTVSSMVLLGGESALLAFEPSRVYWMPAFACLAVQYILCIVIGLSGLKELPIVKAPAFRSALDLLHSLDGVSTLMMGYAIYSKNLFLLISAMSIISKFGMLSLYNRMILGYDDVQKIDNLVYFNIVRTTKSFLHHFGNFLFLNNKIDITLATIWRTLSMSGHAATGLKKVLDPKLMEVIDHLLSNIKHFFVVCFISMLCLSPEVRQCFQVSAAGHIAYMIVRIEPVYRIGSIYIPRAERAEWMASTHQEKFKRLLSLEHPIFLFELVSLAALTLGFVALRVL